ncbi:MAG: hypothetical protein RLZZ49_625, partial [Bacteroidota bacterium]
MNGYYSLHFYFNQLQSVKKIT